MAATVVLFLLNKNRGIANCSTKNHGIVFATEWQWRILRNLDITHA